MQRRYCAVTMSSGGWSFERAFEPTAPEGSSDCSADGLWVGRSQRFITKRLRGASVAGRGREHRVPYRACLCLAASGILGTLSAKKALKPDDRVVEAYCRPRQAGIAALCPDVMGSDPIAPMFQRRTARIAMARALKAVGRGRMPSMTGHATACKAPWAALVVDDDSGVRQSLRLCLEAAGARVLGVATGGAALEALDRGHFDVVFLDLWLGAEAGLDLLPELLQRQPDLGVIVVTAFASIESAVDAVKRGAVDYIPEALHAGSDPADREPCGRSAAPQASAQRARTGARRKRRAVALRVPQPDLSTVPSSRGTRGRIRCGGVAVRRERHWQEHPRALDAQQQSACRGAVRECELPGAVGRSHDQRTLRPSQGSLHGRGCRCSG